LPKLVQIPQLFASLFIPYTRANRHTYDQVLTFTTRPVATHAVLATPGAEGALKAQINKRVEIVVRNQVNTATISAIATVGPPPGYEFLATETDTAIASIAALDADTNLVNKLHELGWPWINRQ